MQIQTNLSNNNIDFGAKGTFLNRAKYSQNSLEKRYWKSLHYEAKTILSSNKLQMAQDELCKIDKFDTKGVLSVAKIFFTMVRENLKNRIFEAMTVFEFPRTSNSMDFEACEKKFFKTKDKFKDVIK